jgi:uncharacterized membrane protein YgaE (UPF0421/DUF939 family)
VSGSAFEDLWLRSLERGRSSLDARWARLRSKAWQIGQCAVAAAVAWLIAADLLHHETPFFAPIAAVVSLGTSYGQRLRRIAEVTLGVAIGVFMGDVFTHVFGTGAWQIGLIVVLGMATALMLDAGAIFVTQAAVQGIVVSVLVPTPGDAFVRWTDALIGGGVALVAAAVVPRAPLRRPRIQAAVVARKIASLLHTSADVIRSGDAEQAMAALSEARATERLVQELRAAADEGLSVLASSPFRRRHREPVRRMVELVDPLEYALRNTRVATRRVAVAAYRREPVPIAYADLLDDLAGIVDAMAADLEAGRMASGAVDDLIRLGVVTSRLERSDSLSGQVVLAQARSIIADLLAVGGMGLLEATSAVPPMEN